MNPYLLVIILGIVEGVTEFLPISSTGHMILVEKFINSPYVSKEFMNNFFIIVQLGAIISVILYFWKDIHPFVKSKEIFQKRINLWSKVVIGVIPAAVLGLLFDDYITEFFMGNTNIIAITLIIYGIAFYFIEDKIKIDNQITKIESIPYKLAFAIGIFQCLAMIPGTSRSGATIIGALLLGLSKGVAAEFSFFLAIPTMIGATLLKLVKSGMNFTTLEWQLLAIGFTISFLVAYFVIKWFMGYIKTKTFKAFGIYRIVLGVLVLIFFNK